MDSDASNELQIRRWLKDGVIDLTIRHPAFDEPLLVQRIVDSRFEAFFDTEDWPAKKAGLFKWGEFEIEEIGFIAWDETMTPEEIRERAELIEAINKRTTAKDDGRCAVNDNVRRQ